MAKITDTTQAFVDAMNNKFGSTEYVFDAIPGRKFDKVTSAFKDNKLSLSVYAFVERETGDLYKASGWAAPAKGVRFSGDKLLTVAVDKADLHGGFLYNR